MKIEKKLSKRVTFADLSKGEVFINDEAVYMVLEEDYGLGEGRTYDGYAVDLETGSIYSFGDDEECTLASAKLTVTD